MSLSSRSPRRRTAPRQPSGPRIAARAPLVAPPDYVREAASVRNDLRWIVIWGGLLLVGLIVAALLI